jgi:serine/threonine-protein kinase
MPATVGLDDRSEYRVIERLAAGGMGQIHLAKRVRPAPPRLVVLKSLVPELAGRAEYRQWLVEEARTLARLQHPNIVQLVDAGWSGDAYHLVLEYVHGLNLHQLLNKLARSDRKLPLPVALRIVMSVARALAHAHGVRDERGRPLDLVHRDVAPANVLLSVDGDVKLGDFGVAKTVVSGGTSPGVVKGKLGYMSPEQASGLPLDRRSDIFSLGVVLWESLLARRLFRRDTQVEALQALLDGPIPRPRSIDPAVPPALDALVMAMLDREPARRPASAGLVAATLDELLAGLPARAERDDVAAFVAAEAPPQRLRPALRLRPEPSPGAPDAPAPAAMLALDDALSALDDEPAPPALDSALAGADDMTRPAAPRGTPPRAAARRGEAVPTPPPTRHAGSVVARVPVVPAPRPPRARGTPTPLEPRSSPGLVDASAPAPPASAPRAARPRAPWHEAVDVTFRVKRVASERRPVVLLAIAVTAALVLPLAAARRGPAPGAPARLAVPQLLSLAIASAAPTPPLALATVRAAPAPPTAPPGPATAPAPVHMVSAPPIVVTAEAAAPVGPRPLDRPAVTLDERRAGARSPAPGEPPAPPAAPAAPTLTDATPAAAPLATGEIYLVASDGAPVTRVRVRGGSKVRCEGDDDAHYTCAAPPGVFTLVVDLDDEATPKLRREVKVLDDERTTCTVSGEPLRLRCDDEG